MVTIEELKLGNRTLEALKFLLSQITELETAISQINISEIKDANTLTKEQIVTLQDVKAAVESINTELSSKKTDFDEKKQNFDTNLSAFRNDKADFDEKKADFDSKNNTALSNFAFIASNVEKINKTSDLLAEAKAILEQIKPIEQRAQTALETLANSQSKFTELDALKATLLELKRSLENISTTGLINDTSTSTTTTYSSTKISTLTQGVLREADASENNVGGKIVRRNAAGNIYATNIYINEPTKAEVAIIKNSLAADKWRFLVRNSDEGILKSMSIKDFMAGQEVDAYTRSQSDAKYELKSTAYTKTESDAKYLRKADKIDAYSKIECDATFIKKTDKIDAYTKQESDDKFALKNNLPELATETKAGIAKLKNVITAKQEDVAVTEKAVSDLFSQIDFRCAARVIFNGQGSVNIIDSKNISSIVKNGAGDYTIKFLKPMEDTNYYIFTSLEPFNIAGPNHIAHPQYQGIKRDSLRIITGYGAPSFADEVRVQVMIFIKSK